MSLTRCAPPHALPSSSSLLPILGIVFCVGALLFALGSWMLRREAQAQREVASRGPDPDVTVSSDVDVEIERDRIERLAMVGQPWCAIELQTIVDTASDEQLRNMAEDALLVIAARSR